MTDTFKLDPADKDLWLKALRSGEYKQGQTALRRGDEYCCLGVLCEVKGVRRQPMVEGSDLYEYSSGEGNIGSTGWIPDDVMTFPRKVQLDLADMNDRGTTFVKIANYIEVNL